MGAVRIGIDIGGTFTDITVLDEATGRLAIAKVPSRRGDPAGALVDAVRRGLELAKVAPGDVTLLVHGTTIVTNAVLENKLPKTALLTTEGFRDILEIGRHFRPDMYDLQQDKAPPVVPRDRRFGVAERTTATGEVIREPERQEVQRLLAQVKESGAEALAICFLNSFVNPANEAKVRDWARAELPGIHVSASCEVCREIREYERMSTVALNAAAMPLVARYLSEIAGRVGAVLPNAKVLLMQSSGGSLTVGAAQNYPVRMLTSGPAGGALAVQRIGKATAYDNLLGVDMGGTSTDISLIHRGELRMTTEGAVAGRPVKLPMIEINTIGAGAGSIAWLDSAGGLHVGPMSAGADPGPVAYGRGGTEPTVTDANLVLGRLHPDRFASGDIRLDREAARRAIAERVGAPLKLSVEQAAAGIIRIANANMERAVRVSSAEKGYDPRSITLVAFGGAGPMHAAALAQAARIPSVLVPEQPGVFSAVGLVMADIRHDAVQTRVLRGAAITPAAVAPLYAALEAEADAALAEDGVPRAKRLLQRTADLRYAGQAYEVNVALPAGTLDAAAVAALVLRFHDRHLQSFAHNHPDKAVEFVSARIAALGLMSAPPIQPRAKANGGAVVPKERRQVYFDEAAGYVATAVYDRERLGPGATIAGPAIVEQIDTTTVIHPGQKARVDDFGNLLIAIGS
ncbi:MAG: hydantoinase/oxoprolinase family protein [Alphaproteobacteria bacterium]|nr:hydantoinase/oxoprolinase family protein [Alphaproteobacteria bacterium]